MQEEVIQDRYRIEEKIGRGTVGEVYRATDMTLDRSVAIKILDQELSDHPRFVERYVHLVRTAASLHHANIVVIHDIVRTPEERVCVVMEYLDGVPLDKALEETTQWPHPQTADVLTGIARALDYAHGEGIYHLGMKASDIILEPERPVVTDFCVLQALQTLTDRYSLRGLPPAYMAPEQIDASQGGHEGPWTDIYVLGIMAYQMIFGMLPFRATTPLAILHAHMEQEVPRPAGCPPEIFDPLRKAMAKSPEERYESAGAFVDEQPSRDSAAFRMAFRCS
ncbi:MAG: serine/threonine-protein kinase [Ardenticatenia bacterium]|nr:serine/threonine-protein kinase [Ardenticatenia bacterium]